MIRGGINPLNTVSLNPMITIKPMLKATPQQTTMSEKITGEKFRKKISNTMPVTKSARPIKKDISLWIFRATLVRI